MLQPRFSASRWIVVLLLSGATVLAACGGGEKVVEVTRVVEKPVAQTVVVEKPVAIEKVVQQTVVVEKPVTVEKVVQQTVVVEKQVDKVVEKVVVQTATPQLPPTPTPRPAAKPAPKSKNARGQLVWATVDGIGTGGFNAMGLCCGGKAMGVVETLFRPTHEKGTETPLLAASWKLDEKQPPEFVQVTLRKGVAMHKGYGELTAEDLVWSVNDTNANTSAQHGSGSVSVTDGSGEWAGFLGKTPAEVIDTYTAKIYWTTFDPRWTTWFFGQDGLGAGVVSKKAFDKNGRNWNLDNLVGTGPFEVAEWKRGESTVVRAVPNHWRKTAQVQTIRRVVVPDETVRLAMLQTGEADIADISQKNVPEVQLFGMVSKGSGTAGMLTVMFAGNLWEDTHPKTGAKLEILTYGADQPWLGNPRTPDDSNNPKGMNDMEQARLVRQALAMSIDRDLVNKAVLSGLGWPVYIPYFDINNANWNNKWKVSFDAKKAEELLDQAGFPRGKNGVRFTMPFYAWNNPGPLPHFADTGDVVAQMWQKIGVDVAVLHYEYAVFRPSLVARSATIPWVDTGPLENFATTPWDWPRGGQMSALTRGGKSHGIEFAEATQNYLAVGLEPDIAKRIALNNKFADYLHHWMPGIGVVAAPSLIVYNPTAIKDWPMELGLRSTYNSPENIILP